MTGSANRGAPGGPPSDENGDSSCGKSNSTGMPPAMVAHPRRGTVNLSNPRAIFVGFTSVMHQFACDVCGSCG